MTVILQHALWAGFSSGALAVALTAPKRQIFDGFVCGFTGRLVLDLLVTRGVGPGWSTVIASAAVSLAAFFLVRDQAVSPVVLVIGILPLGAATAVFNAIANLMKISSLEGEALAVAATALGANTGKVFITSLAIAIGLSAGMLIARLAGRRTVLNEA